MIEETVKKLIFLVKTRLFKNSFYTAISLIFIGLTPFIFNFFVARSFGPKTLGEINVTINFCLIITIFITNFFGSAGNKFLAEYRGRKSQNDFFYILRIIFLGSLLTLLIAGITLFFSWNYISMKFSLPKNLFFPIIIYIFLRTIYILFRRTFYGMDLVKQYAQNEIFPITSAGASSPYIIKVVGADGQVFFPFVGTILVEGLTINEIRIIVREKLKNSFNDPQVDVQISKYNPRKERTLSPT